MTFNVAQANESARKWRERRARELRSIGHQRMPVAAEHFEIQGDSVARIRTVVSPWFRDEQGFPTHAVSAT